MVICHHTKKRRAMSNIANILDLLRETSTVLDDDEVRTIILELEGMLKADSLLGVSERHKNILDSIYKITIENYERVIRQDHTKSHYDTRDERIRMQGGLA